MTFGDIRKIKGFAVLHGRAIKSSFAGMSIFRPTLALVGVVGPMVLAGCAPGYHAAKTIPQGVRAYDTMATASDQIDRETYRINVGDTLKVQVFFEQALSVDSVAVDRTGRIALPALGAVKAEGQTSDELAASIATALRGKYLRNPQVTVAILSSARDKVVVAGQVKQPGVYDVRRGMTLIEALAVASGETDVARLSDVVVYRMADGQQMAAAFNVREIMSGTQPDIKIEGNDKIVVGYSANRAFWQSFRESVGVFSLFYRVSQ